MSTHDIYEELPSTSNVHNIWAHKRGYTLKLYSLMEGQKFPTAIFEVPDDDHNYRNMQCTNNVKNNFKFKKKKWIIRF